MTASKTIYFAGGCFWGVESLFSRLPGVENTCVGYANGRDDLTVQEVNYENVCSGGTGLHESCRVSFNTTQSSADALLYVFFRIIDPTLINRQGADRGTQYQSGVFWPQADRELADSIKNAFSIERKRCEESYGAGSFHVQAQPLRQFYPAEDYHQDYLDKNPGGYCHISLKTIEQLSAEPPRLKAYQQKS